MMNKSKILLLLLFMLLSVKAFSQTDNPKMVPSLSPVYNFDKYRPVGETRLWTFVTRDTTIGQLISVVKEEIEINGRHGYVLDEKLTLDYKRPESQITFDIEGEHYIADNGTYLGDKLNIKINGNSEKFEFRLRDKVLEGFFTRSGEKVKKTIPFETDLFAWENYFIDQLELFLAMKTLRVGDAFNDSIYFPQSMYRTNIAGTVDGFLYKELYRNKFDSVFQIHLTQPQEYYLFLTKDNRLVRMDFPEYRLRAYLDLVQKKPQTSNFKPAFTLTTFLASIPAYFFYLIVAGLSLLFLVRAGFKWKPVYLVLLIGMVLYFLMLITQIPLQKYIIGKWLLPMIATGGSLYGWGFLPALAVGVIQEIAKLALIFLIIHWFKPGENRFLFIGAFCGAGFGFMEASYLTPPSGILGLFSWNLLESSFLILYHTVSGVFFGYAISGRVKRIAAFLVGLILFNAILRYLPVFVQKKAVEVEIMYFVFALLILLLLLLALLFLNKKKTA